MYSNKFYFYLFHYTLLHSVCMLTVFEGNLSLQYHIVKNEKPSMATDVTDEAEYPDVSKANGSAVCS